MDKEIERIEELASLIIDWLFSYHFKKYKKVWTHDIMTMLMQFESNPLLRFYAVSLVIASELITTPKEK